MIRNRKRANYHTHTPRCMHAEGTEREYIEAALAAGIDVLGFSDHVPQPYEDMVSKIRMSMEELPGYIDTLVKLREEYRDRIQIKIGFEVEYVEPLFEKLMGILAQYPVDYLILGQHFVDCERPANYAGRPSDDPWRLKKYVDQVLAGLETGRFSYLAHPDLIRFTGDDGIYEKEMTRLCAGCKKLGIPLEINRLGVYEGRHYPRKEFWEIAAQTGNEVIIGYDAHQPTALTDEETYQRCVRLARELGIRPNEEYRI